MPSLTNNSYKRPFPLCSGHLETIYPALFRKLSIPFSAQHERIFTPDSDFLDLFWYQNDSRKLVIIQHGLEGSADRPYILGMANCFLKQGFDALAWNYRSCGQEMNWTSKFYHSGATYDLDLVVRHAVPKYDEIYLVGFSLGGNLTLKYLGESERSKKIKKAVAVSAPLDLDKGVDNLLSRRGYIYQKRFVNNLTQKVKRKHELNPDQVSLTHLSKIKNVRDFDDYYTAPLHGYEDATDYYHKCSSRYFLSGIQVPTLILNAINDPILSPESLDHQLTKDLPNVTLETSKFGGHVGFARFDQECYWSESRAVSFCNDEL